MNPVRSGSRSFNLERYFFLLSLILMILVTVGMTLYLRHYSSAQLLKLESGRASSLAQVFENSLWPSFRPLAQEQNRDLARLTELSRSSPQRNAVIGLMQDTDVIKFKVYFARRGDGVLDRSKSGRHQRSRQRRLQARPRRRAGQ